MSTLRGFSFVMLAAAMSALVAAKSEMKMGKSLVKISDAGEMEFRRGGVGNASEDAHPIKIKMDEIMQVYNNGTELIDCAEASNSSKPGMGWINNVLKKSAMKIKMRRFRDFAKQNFNFQAKRNKVAMRYARKSIKAAVQKFQTSLSDGIGKIAIELALPEGDGDIDIDGEKQKLKIGDMKFNIEMSEWTWCDNAAFLDVYMKLASKKKPTKRQARSKSLPVSYDLGGNKTVSFSGKYQVDSGAWLDMEDGFPKVDPTDATRIIVRFPRFDQTLVYDPTVSGEDDDADISAASGLSSLSAILIAMATTVVYATLK